MAKAEVTKDKFYNKGIVAVPKIHAKNGSIKKGDVIQRTDVAAFDELVAKGYITVV